MEHDPHEAGVRTADYRKNSRDEFYLARLNEILAEAELPNGGESSPGPDYPVVYIVGAPRSGTTLLSQLVSRCLPVGYINNLIARFWMRPSVGIRLSSMLLGGSVREKISFSSSFGTTEGVHEPHEFGYFWRRWLEIDGFPTHKIPNDALELLDSEGLRETLKREILGQFRLPVVFKNIICGLQASFLTRVYPKSLFVHIKRDPFMTAASILKSRRERFGCYNTWWSLKPSTWPFTEFSGQPAFEVAMQVKECWREIDEELAQHNVLSLQVTYEDLCKAPAKVMSFICESLAKLGYSIHPSEEFIEEFRPSGRIDIPGDMAHQLHIAVNKLIGGKL